ncbi:hypothetical protein BOX15_Mlig001072g3 [Macrostomum lignano]|uniref:Uncharacterized protein n=1 Tax=Macrostomum lignano TaxID=282301 RepID=A0A267FYM8_9PLAT|nr:hypothetical protein BOX15_Mlig001072g3 [Macrostomum lignano]
MGDQLENIPYPSMISFVLILVGGCIMTGTLYEAVRRTDTYFRSTFYPIDGLSYAQTVSVIITPITVVLAAALLAFGCLATGATREKIYRGNKSILSGRGAALVFLALAHLSCLCWLALMCGLMFPATGWLVMDRVCAEEWRYWLDIDGEKTNAKFFNYFRFNLTHYGIYKKLYNFNPSLKYNETITTATAFQNFCSNVNTIGPLYMFALGGAMFVLFGLFCFIGALSANYTKLKYTQDLTQYRTAKQPEVEPAETEYLQAAGYAPSIAGHGPSDSIVYSQ